MAEGPLLTVEGLSVRFGGVTVVDDVSFEVPRRATVALVGESGSGKSVTAHALLRLLPSPPATVRGRITFDGTELTALKESAMRGYRGRRLSLVFQDPGAALDPVYAVGDQVSEALRVHGVGRREAKRRALEMLARVGLPDPQTRYRDYPHELSGGMRQRVMIAIALVAEPALVIADEPTTSLDLIAAANVRSLLAELRAERELSMILISHDLTSVALEADRVVVLYAGRVVEEGPAADVIGAPQHPYTRGLVASIPPIRRRRRRRRKTPTRLQVLPGHLPAAADWPRQGCRFAPRCPEVMERCREEPPMYDHHGHRVRCFLLEERERPLDLVPPVSRRGVDDDDAEPEEELAEAELDRVLSARDLDSIASLLDEDDVSAHALPLVVQRPDDAEEAPPSDEEEAP